MARITFINTALYRGNVTAPLYRLYDGEKITYKAYIIGKSRRGIASASFEHEHLSEVKAWRETHRA